MSEKIEKSDQDTIEVPKDEIKDDSKFFEKDGVIYARVDEKEEEPEVEEPEDKKLEDSELEDSEIEDPKEELDEDLKGTIYEGKTAKEIALMHKQELKKTKTQRSSSPKADDKKDTQVKDAAYYENELDKVEEQLDGMSKFDEGYDELRASQRKLSRRYIAASQREIIETNVNAEKNVEFIEEKRQEYEDLEIEISPEEFDEVTTFSERYMENGLITDRSFTKGLIDKFGHTKVTKFFTMRGEADARRKIKDAGKKVEKKISTKPGKGATGVRYRNISKMNSATLDAYLESLSPDELADLYSKQTRK